MKRSIAVFHTLVSLLAIAAIAARFTNPAYAQLGPPSTTQTTQAIQLPLSGRAGQNGSVNAAQTPVPGATASVNTLNSSVQVQGPYVGSANSTNKIPFSGKLGLREAIDRALVYNLGAVGSAQAAHQAQGSSRVARSVLLPNVNGNVSETLETENLRALGIRFNFPLPGFSFPSVVGPFNYLDVRASLTQTIVDITALNNYRSAAEVSRSNQLSAMDARDLVVLAVGGTYLQVLAAKARVDSERAQVETANAVYQQALQQRTVGLVAQIDANRSQVEALTAQQRLLSLQNDLAKQKINLARLTGLPPTDQYDLSDDISYEAAAPVELADTLKRAFDNRSDLKAAQAQVRAAELAHSAARAERLPSFSVNANYGAIGTNPAQAKATYTVVGTVRVPIWQGGRAEGDIAESDAALAQRRAEIEDLKGAIESEVRNAYLDLQTATSQVELAQKNLDVAKDTLVLARQRFEAGVTDAVEVVQTEQTVASAQLDYINSVFDHNLAKLSLARAMGGASESLPQFLKLH